MIRIAVLLAATLSLAACGGHAQQKAKPARKACRSQARALAKLDRDLALLRSAKTDKAINAGTDKFLLDVATAPITNIQRNRLIDHAAAAVSSKCPQCFQALEAERPIPAIRAGEIGCSK